MSFLRHHYNAKDTIATKEVFDSIHPLLDAETSRIYEAEMGLQGAFLGVQMRGIKIDIPKRDRLLAEITAEALEAAERAERVVEGTTLRGKKGNISVKQLKELLYDKLELREIKDDVGKISTGEIALKKIVEGKVPCKLSVPNSQRSERKDLAAAIAGAVLESRKKFKMVQSLEAPLSPEGRMRFTLVSGGTESFRASSHKAHDGTGVNIQNQDKRLREIYIPDDGYEMGQCDQNRAESLTVAYASGDEEYIKAHLGNTHVLVGRTLFPDHPWPEEPNAARYYAGHTFHGVVVGENSAPDGPGSLYYIAKRTQHGLNYRLTARGLAVQAEIPVALATQVYDRYFEKFHKIRDWHREVIDEVRRTGIIHYPGDYYRIFFGRLDDESTWREAISSIPQATIAWTNHIVFTRMFYQLDGPEFNVLAHGHDAVLYQVKEGHRDEYHQRIKELQKVVWPIKGREMIVPWETKYGANWREVS